MGPEFKIRPYQAATDRRQLQLMQLPEKYINQYTSSSPFYFTLKVLGICTNYLYLMTPSVGANVIGTILLRKRLRGFPAGYVWRIHAVAVTPELRGRGLGFELLNYAFERLKERGVEEVSLKVDATNEPAIRLYRKYGFTERTRIKGQIIFIKRVNGKT